MRESTLQEAREFIKIAEMPVVAEAATHSLSVAERFVDTFEPLKISARMRHIASALMILSAFGAQEAAAQDLLVPPPPTPGVPEANDQSMDGDTRVRPAFQIQTAGHSPQETAREKKGLVQGGRLKDGSEFSGAVVGIGPTSVELMMPEGGMRELPTADVMVISSGSLDRSVPFGKYRMHFLGGGFMTGVRLEVNRDSADIFLNDSSSAKFSRKGIRALQFSADKSCDAEWGKILERQRGVHDLAVIQKGDGLLDFIKGVVTAVTPDKVSFHIDGQDLQIAHQKLYGVVFAPQRDEKIRRPNARLHSQAYTLDCQSVSLRDHTLDVCTMRGENISLPAENFTLDFRPSRTRTIEEVSPRILAWNPIVGLSLERRMDSLFSGGASPVVYESNKRDGLAVTNLRIEGEVQFEIALRGQFSALHAALGDREADSKAMTISVDGTILFPPTEATAESSRSNELVLSLREARTVRFLIRQGAVVNLSDCYLTIAP